MSEVIARPSATKARPKAGAPLRRVPFKVTDPEQIPAQRYYDEEFFRLEAEHLWPKVWQMACRLEEIPEVGDYVEYKILDKSVFVVRTRSGIKAFHNHCRHRGMQLLSGSGNCAGQGITCAFHGWRWNMDGENTFVFFKQIFSEESLDPKELDLVPCRVELWGGCAFINFDDDAAPLLECIRPFAEMHDPRAVDKLKVDWWLAAEIPCNWKLAMEAFQEGYHVMRTHPQFQAVLIPEADNYRSSEAKVSALRGFPSPAAYVDSFIETMAVLSDGMGGGMVRPSDIDVARALKDKVELPSDLEAVPLAWFVALQDQITRQARARNIPMPDLNAIPPITSVNFCFPNYFLLPTFGNMASYRIRPLGPETCLFELWSMSLYPEGEAREKPVAPAPMGADDPRWPDIPAQDFSNLPLQQLGLHSHGFEYMRLARDAEGSISNNHRVIDQFLAGADRETLVRSMQVACASVIDSPTMDIGTAEPLNPLRARHPGGLAAIAG